MLYSEFRDGNVPAGHEQLRVLKDSLRHLPDSVRTVSLRSDTAVYQEELLLYCGEGKYPRFGVIQFAIVADVTEAFRALCGRRPRARGSRRPQNGRPAATHRSGMAEVVYVPNWAGTAATAPITAFSRSANRSPTGAATRRSCRFPPRRSP